MAVGFFSAKAYTKGAEMRLAKAEKRIMQGSKDIVKDLLSAGLEFARINIPKDTGYWASCLVKTSTKVNNNSVSGSITVDPFITPMTANGSRYRGQTGDNFSLTRWSHTSPRAKSHFKSGSPTFMYDTRDYLNRYGMVKAKGFFKNIKL